jgi:DNA polymerase (family X)
VTTSATPPFNRAAAAAFRQCADLLRRQGANPFRATAYVRAAETLEALAEDARDLLRARGHDGLTALPFIGTGLAGAIAEMATTGRLSRLDRLRGAADPETLLRSVPGIGPALARALHETFDVTTLEALELAAHDGRLERLPHVGPRRAAAIRASVAALLRRIGNARPGAAPPVDVLLDVDRQYRSEAAAGALPTITPRRFNPEREAWLPVLHTERGPWHFTALFSNTARAHQLGRTDDWVVVFFHDDDHREAQRTVVTETHGSLAGVRVVRGEEAACAAHYAGRGPLAA